MNKKDTFLNEIRLSDLLGVGQVAYLLDQKGISGNDINPKNKYIEMVGRGSRPLYGLLIRLTSFPSTQS
jgi:hypothetical protein